MRRRCASSFVWFSSVLLGWILVPMLRAAPTPGAPPTQGGRGPATPAPSATADGEFVIRPPWTSAPETIYDNNSPHSTIHRFTMKSTESKIYSGIARGQQGVVPYERPVAMRHTDANVILQTLPRALEWLWQGCCR